MAYFATEIDASLVLRSQQQGAIRQMDGTILHYHYDPLLSPKRGKVYTSTDSGATWTAESWSQAIGDPLAASDGGSDPVLLLDPGDNVWLLTSEWAGVASPHAVIRDENHQDWGYTSVGAIKLSNTTTISGLCGYIIPMDVFLLNTWNVVSVWIKSGVVKTAELRGGGDVTIGGTAAGSVQCACAPNGTQYIIYEDGNDLFMSTRAWPAASWSSPAQINSAEVIFSIEDMTARIDGLPAGVIRHTSGGVEHVELWEQVDSAGTLLKTRVWDGTNTHESHSGWSLQYDRRGSVFVSGMSESEDDGRAESVSYAWFKPFEATFSSWTETWHSGPQTGGSASGGNSSSIYPIDNPVPSALSFQPNRLQQGQAMFVYLWPNGAAADNEDLYFINRDTHPSTAFYPTIFSTAEEEPPYRSNPVFAATSETLTAEGTPSLTFPTVIPQFKMVESKRFVTEHIQFEAPYEAVIAIFEDGRRFFDITFPALGDAQKDSVFDFMDARQKDNNPFYWLPPDKSAGEEVDAVMTQHSLELTKRGDAVWALSFQLSQTFGEPTGGGGAGGTETAAGLDSDYATEKNKLAQVNSFLWCAELQLPHVDGEFDPTLNEAIRVVSNTQEVTFPSSGGPVYYPFPMRFSGWTSSAEGDMRPATLTIPNADKQLMSYIDDNDGLNGKRVVMRLVHTSFLAKTSPLLQLEYDISKCVFTPEVVIFTIGPIDLFSRDVPHQKFYRWTCRWRFGSDECGYEGPNTFCDKTLKGRNGCIVQGLSEIANGLQQNHPSRFGGFPASPLINR